MTGMPDELKLVVESFSRNSRVNRALLATLDMPQLLPDDGAGGWNVGQHLADMSDFRRSWLMRVSPEHAGEVPVVVTDESSTWLTVDSIAQLQEAFDAGDTAIEKAVLAAVSEGRNFSGAYESHPAHFILHAIVHDSHHRGQILALLRRTGRPDEERERLEGETWPIWRE